MLTPAEVDQANARYFRAMKEAGMPILPDCIVPGGYISTRWDRYFPWQARWRMWWWRLRVDAVKWWHGSN